MQVAILAALSAAALFATATALQHRSAGLVSATGGVRAAGLRGFMCKTLRHPMWVLGTVAGIAGVALHAIALRDGPLSLVQPLLVTGVIFALALRRLLEHRRPRRDEVGWAGALALGVALFLAVAAPANGSAQPPDLAPTVLCGALIGLGVLGCCVASRRTTANTAAVLLGTAAGLAFAAAAGLLKETMDILDRGAGALPMAWPPYALVVVGAIGVVLNQLAYRAGPLRFSLPAITSVDPVVSLVIAVAVFDEHFRNGPADLLVEVLGLALVVTAATGITRSGPRSPDDQDRDLRNGALSRMTGSVPFKPPSCAFTTGPAPGLYAARDSEPAPP